MFIDKFKNYLKASFPFLWVQTHEETRIINEIYMEFQSSKKLVIYEWDAQKNLTQKAQRGGSVVVNQIQGEFGLNKVVDSCANLGNTNGDQRIVILFKDFHSYIDTPMQVRLLRNAIERLKTKGITFVFISPVVDIPVELEKDIQLIDFKLPDEAAIETQLIHTINSFNEVGNDKIDIDPNIKVAAIEAAKGLTHSEVENAFALAAIENNGFNHSFVHTVFQEKVQQVKKSGLLTYLEADTSFEDIGGLESLKEWTKVRSKAYSDAARKFGLPYPKGILLCGIPGCGKTLLAKAASKEFGFPLFLLDVGGLFGKHVGETEENVRNVVRIIDGVGRCILFIDEIEKSLNRNAVSGQSDGGTSSRSFATLLNWLSEHKSPVFVIATSNDHTKLPPELTRKGRFDELFWIDLPTDEDRLAITTVLLKRYKRDPKKFEKDMPRFINLTNAYTGAEIEQIIVGAMFNAFDVGREMTMDDMINEAMTITPLSKVCATELTEMRQKADGKLRPVTSKLTSSTSNAARKISASL